MTETTENQSTINPDLIDSKSNEPHHNHHKKPHVNQSKNIRTLKAKDATQSNKQQQAPLAPLSTNRKQGEKIQNLKNQIEKQMKDYVQQEEYEEVLKLLKKLNLIDDEKWQELEDEVDKLDYTDIETKSSASILGGSRKRISSASNSNFITEDEIAVLATDLNNTPYYSKSVNEIIELSRKNSELRQSTLFFKEPNNSSNSNEKSHLYKGEKYEMRDLSNDMNVKKRDRSNDQKLNNNENNISNSSNNKQMLNYAHKRSILRKLMIAQRQQFLVRKEQVELQKLKSNLADTSISNVSFTSGVIKQGEQQQQQQSSDKRPFNESSNDQQDENIKLLYDVWDTARIVDNEETYEQRVHFFHLSLQILKVVTYIVLGIVVLASAIVGKGAFLLMTNAVGHVETNAQNPYRERWVWMLIIAICAPYLFTFFDSVFRSLFGKKPWPTLKILILVSFS
jgi:hypothetical protein